MEYRDLAEACEDLLGQYIQERIGELERRTDNAEQNAKRWEQQCRRGVVPLAVYDELQESLRQANASIANLQSLMKTQPDVPLALKQSALRVEMWREEARYWEAEYDELRRKTRRRPSRSVIEHRGPTTAKKRESKDATAP